MAAPPSQPSPSNQPVLEENQGQQQQQQTPATGDGSPTSFMTTSAKAATNASVTPTTNSVEEPSYKNSENSQWYVAGKSMLEDGDFENALMMIEDGINAAKEKLVGQYGMNEDEAMMHESMAPLHYLYGTTLLYSIEESDESQAMTVGGQLPVAAAAAAPTENNDGEPELVDTSEVAATEGDVGYESNEEEYQEEQDEDAPVPPEDATEDMQIAWENLDLARTIIETILQQNETQKTLDSVFVNKLKQDLAQVYLREGDLQRTNGKYENAIADYDKTLKLLLAAHGPERKIAEVHYNLGLTHFTFVACAKASTNEGAVDYESELNATEQQQQQPREDPAKVEEKLMLARGRGFYHYEKCAMTFGSILVNYCGLDPHTLMSKIEMDLPANKKCSDDDDEPSMEDPKMASLKVNKLRDFVSKLTPNAEFKDKYDDFVAVLDEIQETIDEAEVSEQGVQEVTAMKEQIAAAVAAGMGDGVGDASGCATLPTTTIGFGTASLPAASSGFAGVESQTTNILTAVRKKPKKHDSSEEEQGQSKRAKTE